MQSVTGSSKWTFPSSYNRMTADVVATTFVIDAISYIVEAETRGLAGAYSNEPNDLLYTIAPSFATSTCAPGNDESRIALFTTVSTRERLSRLNPTLSGTSLSTTVCRTSIPLPYGNMPGIVTGSFPRDGISPKRLSTVASVTGSASE